MSLVNVIIRHFYHLYVYMSHLTVSEGLFVIVLSICPMPLPQQDIFVTLLSICPTFLIHWDIFRPLSFICPVWFFQPVLCRTEMFRKGKSVYLLVSITKKPGNTQLNVLPPPSSFVFRHYPQSVFLLHPYESFPS